jgi:hypothetical protein
MKLALRIVAAALPGLLAAPASTAAPAAKPEPGIYNGEFCVATSDAAPHCGPAQLELLSSGTAAVRVADLVYVMQTSGSDIAVVLMQQGMQLDDFTVPFEWVGRRLQFYDRARSTSYELRFPQAPAEKR